MNRIMLYMIEVNNLVTPRKDLDSEQKKIKIIFILNYYKKDKITKFCKYHNVTKVVKCEYQIP